MLHCRKRFLALFLYKNKVFAEKDRPELRLQTDNIEEAYAQVAGTHPQLLHLHLKSVTLGICIEG